MFYSFVESLILILNVPHGVELANLLLLKEAALNCLTFICVDCDAEILKNFNFSILTDLLQLKRSFLSKAVFEFCITFVLKLS